MSNIELYTKRNLNLGIGRRGSWHVSARLSAPPAELRRGEEDVLLKIRLRGLPQAAPPNVCWGANVAVRCRYGDPETRIAL